MDSGPQVLPLGTHANAVPSVIFIGEDGQSVVGEAAERRGFAHPERLAREFKRRMGDDVPLVIGDVCVLPEDLFATMVRWVVDRAEEREGEPPAAVTLTHPAEWGGHRTALLHKALAGVGLAGVSLLTEPVAAALHYAVQERVEPGSTLAVYDFGGGTFDATVVRKTDADTFTILGTPEGIERLGGADFDQDVFRHVVTGASEAFAGLDSADPDALSAVARVRRECAAAKEALSTDPEATIAVLLPGAHTQVRLVRSEFEAMIEARVHETIDLLEGTVASAGVAVKDLTAVLLIGGSSRIPLVAQLISERLLRPVAIDADPKASIALGAAFATAALQDTDDGAAGDAGTAPGRDAYAAGPDSQASAAYSFTAQHGPHHLTANKRIGTRVMAVTAAVGLLGVLTATAANSPTSMAALSGIVAGPEQAAAAAEPPAADAQPGSVAPSDDAAPGHDIGSVPGANWFDTIVRSGSTTGGNDPARGTGGRAGSVPAESGPVGTKLGTGDLDREDASLSPGAKQSDEPDEDPESRDGTRSSPDSSTQSPSSRSSAPSSGASSAPSPTPPSATRTPIAGPSQAGSDPVREAPATAPALGPVLPETASPDPLPSATAPVPGPVPSASDSADAPAPSAAAPVPGPVPSA
ncbi:Hsp70 family protein, partial [Arthrobacter sp. Br18]|uniref:Hsp70 family protein n=1 Tax=Arthrobacter sp. Br18 TaxID=1312954 RepID=UPI0020A67F0D